MAVVGHGATDASDASGVDCVVDLEKRDRGGVGGGSVNLGCAVAVCVWHVGCAWLLTHVRYVEHGRGL